MIVFYIGGAICAGLLAVWQLLAAFIRFESAKQFNGPTFGEEMIRHSIMKSVFVSAFSFLVSAFIAVGFTVLALGGQS